MAVDETLAPRSAGAPSAPTSARPSTVKPRVAPISRSRATLPPRLWPKWKSSPTTTARALRQPDQHLVDELLGRLRGPLLVEVHDVGGVDAGGGEQLELLVEVAQQAGRRLGPHDHGRVAVEGDHDGLQALGGGQRPDLVDDGLVAEVHAVVRADGDGARLQRGGARADAVDDLHGGDARDASRRGANSDPAGQPLSAGRTAR